ncbi:MAG: hypothetical protein EOL97_02710 [Spirochaetia bacterium]|nr:hypothetical protein [Spirochaetia bacterium]
MDNLNFNNKYIYRVFGILATFSAFVLIIADYLLEFNKDYGVEISKIVENNWIYTPDWRFSFSIYLCSFLIPFYILGFYLLYKVLSKTNKLFAIVVFTLFSYGVIMGSPSIHTTMSLNGLIYKFGIMNDISSNLMSKLIADKITKAIFPVFVIHYLLTWIATPSILFVYIIRGKSEFKRWVAFLNPFIFLIIGLVGLSLAPSLFKYLTPGSINKGNFALFLLVTIKCWNYNK